MFITVHTKERGDINMNTDNVSHVFQQGDNVFIEMISGVEMELDTGKMTHEELMALLGGG